MKTLGEFIVEKQQDFSHATADGRESASAGQYLPVRSHIINYLHR